MLLPRRDFTGKAVVISELVLPSAKLSENNIVFNIHFSIAFHGLHESLIGIVYEKFQREDAYFFEKSKVLADMNVTAEQFGGSENYAIHLSAAVS